MAGHGGPTGGVAGSGDRSAGSGGAGSSGGGTAGNGGASDVAGRSGIGGSSNDAVRDGGGDDAAFAPAAWPAPNPCDLLALADVQTLQPNISVTVELDPLITGDYWLYRCQWGVPATNPGEIVELDLYGALTPLGGAILEMHFWATPDASVEVITELGTKAEYENSAGTAQTLATQTKSYWIELTARSFTPGVPELSLQPLVAKVIREL